ncbi:trypsin alpha-3 [Aplysia californica]|uniref:Trypsin alpha-3 n=1 Tax=Aplysia californica TaxID=6500 RepID=A0ABM0JW36_APLCA|nr:trypsin alpha-3 [Aplysia californica]
MLRAVFFIGITLSTCLGAPDKRAVKIDAGGCGLRPLLSDNGASEINGRIVGGTEAVPFSWPSICSFMTNTGYHICGSTLVKNKAGVYYLVTAAHCISQRRPRNYMARCGMHSMSGSNPNSVLLTFSAMSVHGGYSDVTFENDIAIFTLTTQPPTNDYVQPACIASKAYFGGEPAIVAGWGTLSYGGEMASKLKQVNKPIKPDSTCSSRYPLEFDATSMMCAGEPEGGVDACQGDSGGPLYTYRNGEWTLTGVVSWGYGCAAPRNPGVYADVHNLLSWIDNVIN